MKISKKVREEAALICQIAASAPTGTDPLYNDIADAIGAGYQAERLAMRAWRRSVGESRWTREVDAEAEAILRTGWSP